MIVTTWTDVLRQITRPPRHLPEPFDTAPLAGFWAHTCALDGTAALLAFEAHELALCDGARSDEAVRDEPLEAGAATSMAVIVMGAA